MENKLIRRTMEYKMDGMQLLYTYVQRLATKRSHELEQNKISPTRNQRATTDHRRSKFEKK